MNGRRGFFDTDPKDRSGRGQRSTGRGSFPSAGRPGSGVGPSREHPSAEDPTVADRSTSGTPDRVVRSRRKRPAPKRAQKKRTPARWILVILWWGVQMAVAGAVGVLVFDRVLMPRFVEQGAEVEVPAVHGIAVSDARAILEQAGLEPSVTDGRFSQIADAGTILESSPGPGLLVKLGRKVFLTPSLGTESRTVPDLRSLSLRLAGTRLKVAGLEVGSVDYTATDEVPPGVVLASTPSPGSPVRGAGRVSLLMSRPRRPVPFWMPSLEGRAGIETAAWLQACGFEVDLTESTFPGTEGDVLRHEPRAGEPIYSGDRVELVVVGSGRDDVFDRDRSGFRERDGLRGR